MLRIIEGKTKKGRVLLEDSVTSWAKARPLALRFIAKTSVGHTVQVEFGGTCQTLTMDKKQADKILAS